MALTLEELKSFYNGKKVLVTGHTGFKGSWLVRILTLAGAQVTGYALNPPTDPNLFEIAGLEDTIHSVVGDVRDLAHLRRVFDEVKPEIVFHLAAQPIVRESYKEPVYTYETNVMGTVNILECVRLTDTVRSFLNVTTDKVYENKEWEYGYRECDPLDGYDPYSNSKSCSELVTHSYKKSFFEDGRCAISTSRAGNVIGGGDFASDRIIPDCVRAMEAGKQIGRAALIAAIMEELERIYEIFQKTEDLSGLYEEYNQICVNCGRKIRVLEPGHEYTGVAEGINQDGELMVVRDDTGEKVSVYAGEVSVRGFYGYV